MAAGDLTDLTTCHTACNITTSSPATDAILQAYISALSAYVPNVINCNILADNYSEIYTGNGKSRMLLRQRPVIQITSVAWRGMTITSVGDEFAGTSGFWSDGRTARLVNYCFPLNEPVQIIYSAGYVTVPLDVSLAVAELVAEAYTRRTHVGENSRSQGGQVTVSFDPKTMHAAIADKLQNYMHGAPC